MILKPLATISEVDLDQLISNGVSEGRTLDYKRQLPGTSDDAKKEFLADVSSFANTSGGDLLFGVEETEGIASAIVGISPGNLDLEIQRLESIIAAGLDPRIRYATRVVQLADGKSVVIFRIERSWNGPHRVIFKSHDKFYGRSTARKYPLDVEELRSAFTLSATVAERMRAFRLDRVIALANNDTPIPLEPGPKVILHCLPLQSFAGTPQFDVLMFGKRPELLPPPGVSGWNFRITFEGVVCHSNTTYVQAFRNGVVEAVNSHLIGNKRGGKSYIPGKGFEQELLHYLPRCLQAMRALDCSPPIFVALSLTGTSGLYMATGQMWEDVLQPITSEQLLLPEAEVAGFDADPVEILRPLFDMVWNACGYLKSWNFDDSGRWAPRPGP